jgi:protein-tyrosine phosphatase
MENMYDIHCHAVPGVDDGASSLNEALDILNMEYRDGVRTIILTPHFRRMMFETSRETVRERFELLKAEAQKVFPSLALYLGCEFHTNMDMTDIIQQDESYRMAGSRFILLEFSGGNPAEYIRDRVYQAVAAGYEPIIAHVERYSVLWKDMETIEYMLNIGARLQVNAESLLGRSGRHEKKFCHKLADNDMLSFIGSDAHDTSERPPLMGECAKYVAKKWGQGYAEEIFVRNPSEILL